MIVTRIEHIGSKGRKSIPERRVEMAQTWFADPELAVTNFSVSSVCNNLSKEGDVLVR